MVSWEKNSWEKKVEWRKEFSSLGVERVRKRVALAGAGWSVEKFRYAQRWLWRQDHKLIVIGMVVAAIGVTVAIANFLFSSDGSD